MGKYFNISSLVVEMPNGGVEYVYGTDEATAVVKAIEAVDRAERNVWRTIDRVRIG